MPNLILPTRSRTKPFSALSISVWPTLVTTSPWPEALPRRALLPGSTMPSPPPPTTVPGPVILSHGTVNLNSQGPLSYLAVNGI